MTAFVPAELSPVRAAIDRLPRVRLAHLPTPLEPCPRLSRALGDVEIWIKRDDATGLAFGGNKARQLEFTLGEALARGADCIIQGAASQSNHCRQTAAACARLGLECILVLRRDAKSSPVQGNLLLDHILGARVVWTEAALGPDLEAEKHAVGERLRAEGRRPYVIGEPGAKMLGAVAYLAALLELHEQMTEQGLTPHAVYVCSAGPTLAGLALGARLLGDPYRVVAIAPIRWPDDARAQIAGAVAAAAAELGVAADLLPEDLHCHEEYVGPAYGVLTPEARAAIELTARTEGILLDPVYTGKAMAGMIDHVRRGVVPPGATLVFIHTGGTPALFAYADELVCPAASRRQPA
ncbi:MAG: D-cysteine desulfhydrase family protein [Armatimonadetes bacterium]|nr:D-cysteine desulfhydrase family protein [Armatimonadota bacterium]